MVTICTGRLTDLTPRATFHMGLKSEGGEGDAGVGPSMPSTTPHPFVLLADSDPEETIASSRYTSLDIPSSGPRGTARCPSTLRPASSASMTTPPTGGR